MTLGAGGSSPPRGAIECTITMTVSADEVALRDLFVDLLARSSADEAHVEQLDAANVIEVEPVEWVR